MKFLTCKIMLMLGKTPSYETIFPDSEIINYSKGITVAHHLVIANSRAHLEIQMAGEKSTAVVSVVSYYNFMTSRVVVLHTNIPTA